MKHTLIAQAMVWDQLATTLGRTCPFGRNIELKPGDYAGWLRIWQVDSSMFGLVSGAEFSWACLFDLWIKDEVGRPWVCSVLYSGENLFRSEHMPTKAHWQRDRPEGLKARPMPVILDGRDWHELVTVETSQRVYLRTKYLFANMSIHVREGRVNIGYECAVTHVGNKENSVDLGSAGYVQVWQTAKLFDLFFGSGIAKPPGVSREWSRYRESQGPSNFVDMMPLSAVPAELVSVASSPFRVDAD